MYVYIYIYTCYKFPYMSRISIGVEHGTDYLMPKRLVFLRLRGMGEVGRRDWAKGFGRRELGSRGWKTGVGQQVLVEGVPRPLQKGHPKKLKKGTGPPNSRPTTAQPSRPTLRPTLFGSDAISRNRISELIFIYPAIFLCSFIFPYTFLIFPYVSIHIPYISL